MAILITFLAGISIMLGAVIIRSAKNPESIERLSIALALGSMLALLIFDLIPEVVETGAEKGMLRPIVFLVIGFVILKILDLFVPEHEDTEANHDTGNAAHIGMISALAVILHNILEGMTVYTLTLSSFQQGLIFALGISLHNIPMGMLIFSTLAGKSRRDKAVLMSIVSFSTVIGGLLTLSVRSFLTPGLIGALVCTAAGMLIYIVFMELLPHVLKTKPIKRSLMGAAAGFVLVFIACSIGG